jgi:hypothetical protein
MRWPLLQFTFASLALALNVVGHGVRGQDSSQSADANKPLAWRRVVHLHDGRTFVSDGALALDLELVKPAERPKQDLGEASANIVEGYLNAQLPNEYALSQLTRRGETYAAPNGVTLNPSYIEYLRRTLPESRVRLRMKGPTEPVVVLLDAKAVGLLMPMRSVNPAGARRQGR